MVAEAKYGFVIIGRNEGERLKSCLRSISPGSPIVYVDSASTDGSVSFAENYGAEVVALDLSRPFTAARARNEGLDRLVSKWPTLRYVQFVDGDCELVEDWCETALEALEADANIAIVCGQRVEKYPDRSFYNAMADAEWNTPVGQAKECGGDAMMRISALQEIGAYDPAMTAHEEPEMCSRLRANGHTIWRLDAQMTRHDADIHRFGQWWRRSVRGGYGYAQAFEKARRLRKAGRSAPLESASAGLLRRAVQWGLVFPAMAVIAFFIHWLLGLMFLALYPAQIMRRFLGMPGRDWFTLRRAVFEMISKFAEARGYLIYLFDRLRSRTRNAISYK